MTAELFEDCLQIGTSGPTVESLKTLPTAKGVVLFADTNDRAILLLIAGNIRRCGVVRLLNQSLETSAKRANIAEITRKIYFSKCYCDFRTRLRHYKIARALYPDSYRELITFGKQTCVSINLHANWPFFSAVSKPSPSIEGRKTFGPFPTLASVREFIQALQDAFGLCRSPKLIDNISKAQSCTYLQMDSCPGPCVGKISKEKYLEQVNDAVSAAGGKPEKYKARLQSCMESLAQQREFEKAQVVKKQLSSLELLAKENYRWTGELSELTILHIDRSAKIVVEGKRKKIQTYSAFLIKAGNIIEFDDLVLENIGEFYKSLLEQLAGPVISVEPKQLIEQLSLTAYFLYRRNRPGVWINLADSNRRPSAVELEERIGTRFDLPSGKKEDD